MAVVMVRVAVLAVLVLAVVSIAGAAGPATSLDVTAFSQKSVTVRWVASSGATGYRLYKDGASVSTAGASATTARFGSLTWAPHVFGVEPLPNGGLSTITVEGRWLETGTSEPPPPPPPPPPPTGATVFLSPTGSDSASCSQAAPCRTLQRGVTVAQPGQTVELAAGDYNGSVSAQKAAPGVTARIAATGNVTMSGFSCSRCAGVTLEGDAANPRRLSVRTFGSLGGARVTLRYAWLSWDGSGGNSYVTDASDQITIDRNEIGPVTNCGNFHVNTHIPAYSTNIVWSGNFFHDFSLNAGCHSESIWLAAVNGGGLIGNKFKRIYGNTGTVFITTTDGTNCQGIRNFVIKDNYFGPTSSGSGYGMQFAWDPGGSGDCGGPAPHAVHQNLDFSGNCWDGNQVVFATITNDGLPSGSHGIVPGGSVVGEYGSLSSSQHDEGLQAGFTFDQWPYKPIGSCPLDSSG